jgi:hypothetical protein
LTKLRSAEKVSKYKSIPSDLQPVKYKVFRPSLVSLRIKDTHIAVSSGEPGLVAKNGVPDHDNTEYSGAGSIFQLEYDITSDTIVGDGLRDLKDGIIRLSSVLSNNNLELSSVRLLEAVELAAKYGYTVDSNVSAACLEQEFQKKFLSDACGRLSDQINKNLGCSWFNRYILLLHSMNLLPAVMSGPNDVDQNQNFYIVKVPVEQGRQPLFRRLEEGAIRRGKYEHEAVSALGPKAAFNEAYGSAVVGNSLAAEWLRTVVQGENLNSNPKNAVFSSSSARQADRIDLLKEIGSSLDSIRLCFSALSNDHGSHDAELRWVILNSMGTCGDPETMCRCISRRATVLYPISKYYVPAKNGTTLQLLTKSIHMVSARRFFQLVSHLAMILRTFTAQRSI